MLIVSVLIEETGPQGSGENSRLRRRRRGFQSRLSSRRLHFISALASSSENSCQTKTCPTKTLRARHMHALLVRLGPLARAEHDAAAQFTQKPLQVGQDDGALDSCKLWCHYGHPAEHHSTRTPWSEKCQQDRCSGCSECLAAGKGKGWLPVFNSAEELEAHPMWATYFRRVYGELPNTFPIDVSDFQILYQNYLPHGHLESLATWHGDSKAKGCPHSPLQIYRHMSVIDAPRTAYVWHPPKLSLAAEETGAFSVAEKAGHADVNFWKKWGNYAAYPGNSNVEVTHCTGRVVTRCEQHSTWMYAQKGSGVFYNLGRTKAFDTHADAVQHFLPGNKCKWGHCEHEYEKLFAAASKAGYDSLQFTHVGDQLCGLTSIEIVATYGNGTQVCDLEYKSGWNGDKPCACQADLKCANCQHSTALKTGHKTGHKTRHKTGHKTGHKTEQTPKPRDEAASLVAKEEGEDDERSEDDEAPAPKTRAPRLDMSDYADTVKDSLDFRRRQKAVAMLAAERALLTAEYRRLYPSTANSTSSTNTSKHEGKGP